MIILLALFGFSVLGMAVIVARHVPEALRLPDEKAEGLQNGNGASKSSMALGRIVITAEHYTLSRVIPAILRVAEHGVLFIEKGMSFVSGKLLIVRMLIRDWVYRFRVTPRESLYWREMHAWKNNGVKPKKKTESADVSDESLKNGDHDISHHEIE